LPPDSYFYFYNNKNKKEAGRGNKNACLLACLLACAEKNKNKKACFANYFYMLLPVSSGFLFLFL
jgi:hypothetical protein